MQNGRENISQHNRAKIAIPRAVQNKNSLRPAPMLDFCYLYSRAESKMNIMKLIKSNRYLQSAQEAASGLWVSAKTSSAVEGIRQPFARDAKSGQFINAQCFVDHWKKRTSKSAL